MVRRAKRVRTRLFESLHSPLLARASLRWGAIPVCQQLRARQSAPARHAQTALSQAGQLSKTHNSQLPNRRAAASFLRLGPKRPDPTYHRVRQLCARGRFR